MLAKNGCDVRVGDLWSHEARAGLHYYMIVRICEYPGTGTFESYLCFECWAFSYDKMSQLAFENDSSEYVLIQRLEC